MPGLSDTNGRLFERFGRLFSDFLGEVQPFRESQAGPVTHRAFPPLNLWEDEDNLYAECELPGVRMEDLAITVVGPHLTVKGQRAPFPSNDATVHRRERDHGSFQRVVHLPVAIDTESVSAELRSGVLTLTLPKAPEARPRKIEVKCLSS